MPILASQARAVTQLTRAQKGLPGCAAPVIEQIVETIELASQAGEDQIQWDVPIESLSFDDALAVKASFEALGFTVAIVPVSRRDGNSVTNFTISWGSTLT